jgi:putative peptide zinc metalloprotease protein
MNLAEALDVLPEISTPTRSDRPFKMDNRYVGREHKEEGATVVLAHIPGSTSIFRFSPEQWKLVHYFDGKRTCEEVVQIIAAETSLQYDAQDVSNYAEELEEIDFWYKSAQEKNIALMQKLREKRKKNKKARSGDLARVLVAHWDADKHVTALHTSLGFVFTPWFTALTLCLFAFMAYVFIDRWAQIGTDTLRYYTFSDKTLSDLGEFWLLFFVLAFFHESAHALVCKHYRGGVHSMGFHLIYLTPAFFVDVTEAWVYANRVQRIITMLAGIWVELIICALGTLIWWGTPPGSFSHELAYKVMLITGVAVVLMNLNPLIKLDGYYILSEAVGIDEIKEKSTAFVSKWVQRNIFRLPVEVPHVRRQRLWFFVPYALLSGLYSYVLLYAVAKFSGNVFRNYSPEWAFVPTLLVALLIFKSRIRKLGTFSKTVFEEKRKHIAPWFSYRRALAAGIVVALILFVPFWHASVSARFVLEPARRATVRAAVEGSVTDVFVHEGQVVGKDTLIARLRNLELESESARTRSDLAQATSAAVEAQLRYGNTGAAEQQRQQLRQKSAQLGQQLSELELRAPFNGTVTTPHVSDLVQEHVLPGTDVAEIADLTSLNARLFIPESEMKDVKVGQRVSLKVDGLFSRGTGFLASVAPGSSSIESGLQAPLPYKGLEAPPYYVGTVPQANQDGGLRYGMTGTARVYIGYRSLVGIAWRVAADFVGRKLW